MIFLFGWLVFFSAQFTLHRCSIDLSLLSRRPSQRPSRVLTAYSLKALTLSLLTSARCSIAIRYACLTCYLSL
ncbi:hypothetical protein LINPERHAP1_LOCUS21323 [Linum perenne]